MASLKEALDKLKSGKVDAPTVVFTFDDGYRDNYLNLNAVKSEIDFPAALFVCTEKIELGQEFGHDRSQGEAGFLPFSWEQLRKLKTAGFEIGTHTRSHFDCGSRDESHLRDEIVGSKQDLESKLGTSVEYFSFPWGKPKNISSEALDIASSAYVTVFAADGGANLPQPGAGKLLKRIGHCNDVWELELNLQSILELKDLLPA